MAQTVPVPGRLDIVNGVDDWAVAGAVTPAAEAVLQPYEETVTRNPYAQSGDLGSRLELEISESVCGDIGLLSVCNESRGLHQWECPNAQSQD